MNLGLAHRVLNVSTLSFGPGTDARVSHLACGVSHGEAELGARRRTIHVRCGSLWAGAAESQLQTFQTQKAREFLNFVRPFSHGRIEHGLTNRGTI